MGNWKMYKLTYILNDGRVVETDVDALDCYVLTKALENCYIRMFQVELNPYK